MGTNEPHENQDRKIEYVRDELLAAECENDPWAQNQAWDYSFPDSDPETWHICPDFIDPMVRALDRWILTESTIEEIHRLAHFGDHMGQGTHPGGVVSASDVADWYRAKAWLDIRISAECRMTFERAIKAISQEAAETLVCLAKLYREGDRVLWDGDTESDFAIGGPGTRLIVDHLPDLRSMSAELRKRVPVVEGGSGNSGDEPEEAGGEGTPTDRGVPWQAVADYLECERTNGQPFTSQADYAKRLQCSTATVNKAIKKIPDLQEWSKRAVSSTSSGPSPEGAVLDKTPQQREPDPAGIIEQRDVDVALAYLLDHATPQERARIHAMSPAERRELAETAYRDPDRERLILGEED